MRIIDFPQEVGAIDDAEQAQIGNNRTQMILNRYQVWNKDSCKGYCIKAMQDAGISKSKIRSVLGFLDDNFRSMSVDDARLFNYDFML